VSRQMAVVYSSRDFGVIDMRLILFCLAFVSATSPALTDEWASRNGSCFNWQGYWTVNRDQSGIWSGYIDFQHVGGPCAPASRHVEAYEVRAVIVGEDFFAHRASPTGKSCYMHGRVYGDEVRGSEACTDGAGQFSFAMSLKRP
jgi:hypothetical protein